jgi:hypothetical protein
MDHLREDCFEVVVDRRKRDRNVLKRMSGAFHRILLRQS